MALATRPTLSPAEAVSATPPKLRPADLRAVQHNTLHAPRLRCDVVSRVLFAVMDLALDEVLRSEGEPMRWFRDRVLPRLLAAIYHPFTWLVLLVSPPYSYRLNAAFEDHAEHECMAFVAQHPQLDQVAFASQLGDVFGHLDTVADLLRQIGHDERTHKHESLREAARRTPCPPSR